MNNISADKTLGQHWLRDRTTLISIVESAQVADGDVVLEIGPGLGDLTKLLCSRAKSVIAIELDHRLIETLKVQVTAENLIIINNDILSFDFSSLPKRYKIVANIPYYLTSNLLRVISESDNPPLVASLLVQKEVGERVCSSPGDMSILSVSVQYYWQVRLGKVVPAGLFSPPPKVDSMVLVLNRKAKLKYDKTDTKGYFKVVKAGFSQKRKTLLNSLSAGLRLERNIVNSMSVSAGIDPSRRPQTLSLDEWGALYEAYKHQCQSQNLI